MSEHIKKKIAVLPGDGVGPEVIHQAVKVLRAVEERFGVQFEFEKGLIGAEAIDQTGNPLPQETIDLCETSDAILLGAVGAPKYDNDPDAKVRPEQGLLGLRKNLGLYLNVRPLKVFEQMVDHSNLKPEVIRNVDFTIYRELSSGIYFGDKSELEKGGDTATDLCKYTVGEVERVLKEAFKAARKRRGKLCVVDKANVLATSRLWRKTARKMAAESPDVEVDYMFVDNAAMQLVLNPAQFDVIATSNMFGDILSDLASTIGGSIGLLPSASFGPGPALFEPVHGSYPQAAGKDIANPIAMILSAAQMLDHFELGEAADTVRSSVEHCLSKGLGTPDLHPEHEIGCARFGDMVAVAIHDGQIQLKNQGTSTGVSTII